MRYVMITSAVLLSMSTVIALAQSPFRSRPRHRRPARPRTRRWHLAAAFQQREQHHVGRYTGPSSPPRYRRHPSAPNATAQDYLRAARASLVAGQTGATQQSLEMAETRALDRSVPIDLTNAPGSNGLISQIREARDALAAGNNQHAIQMIDMALSS